MRIGFIGTGAMAQAIARGAVASGVDPATLVFSNRTPARASPLADELGASAASPNVPLARQVDIIVLAVKPKDQRAVIKEISSTVVGRPDVCVASLAAGRTLDQIATDFGAGIPLVRIMPNVAATVGQSMTAVTASGTTDAQVSAVCSLMDSVGRTILIDEDYFPVFQALASCSPAWYFQIVDSFARAGLKHGLSKDSAVEITAQAMAGAAALLLAGRENGTIPAQLIDRVTSPGGTTIAGLLAAEEGGLSTALVSAVDASIHADSHLG